MPHRYDCVIAILTFGVVENWFGKPPGTVALEAYAVQKFKG